MFDDVLGANARYRSEFHDSGVAGRAAKGLAVVTCIDSRIDPLAMLGLRPGDAKIIRNAGARVTDDALRSLVLAVNLLGVNRVCVVQHTDCAMVGANDDEMRAKVAAGVGRRHGRLGLPRVHRSGRDLARRPRTHPHLSPAPQRPHRGRVRLRRPHRRARPGLSNFGSVGTPGASDS